MSYVSNVTYSLDANHILNLTLIQTIIFAWKVQITLVYVVIRIIVNQCLLNVRRNFLASVLL